MTAVALLVAGAALGWSGVFGDGGALAVLAAVGLTATALTAGSARIRGPVAAKIGVLGAGFVIAAAVAGERRPPTPATIAAVTGGLRDGWAQILDTRLPVEPRGAPMTTAVAVLWVAGCLAAAAQAHGHRGLRLAAPLVAATTGLALAGAAGEDPPGWAALVLLGAAGAVLIADQAGADQAGGDGTHARPPGGGGRRRARRRGRGRHRLAGGLGAGAVRSPAPAGPAGGRRPGREPPGRARRGAGRRRPGGVPGLDRRRAARSRGGGWSCSTGSTARGGRRRPRSDASVRGCVPPIRPDRRPMWSRPSPSPVGAGGRSCRPSTRPSTSTPTGGRSPLTTTAPWHRPPAPTGSCATGSARSCPTSIPPPSSSPHRRPLRR